MKKESKHNKKWVREFHKGIIAMKKLKQSGILQTDGASVKTEFEL